MADEDDADGCRTLPDFSDTRSPEVVALMLVGCTDGEIAAKLNVGVRTVFNIRRRDELDEFVALLRRESAERQIYAYEALGHKVIRTAMDLLDDPDKRTRMQALKMLLEFLSGGRGGEGAQLGSGSRRMGGKVPPDAELRGTLRAMVSGSRRGGDAGSD